MQGADGTLYGTAGSGEGNVRGIVFKVQPDGSSFTVLKWFTNSLEGASPQGLTLSDSTLYGTMASGGSSNCGTVFKLNNDGTDYAVLKHFGSDSSDGKGPSAGLTLSGRTLYGTTYSGGSLNYGTVFKVNTDGTDYTVLKHFTGNDGSYPYAGLTLSGSTLYGTTSQGGGSSYYGTLFKVNTDGTDYAVLKRFTGGDGTAPFAGLTLSGSTLYGTTYYGGGSGGGTLFKVNMDGTDYTVLKHFTGNDGSHPYAGLVLSGSTLYGTTYSGGSSGEGTVFKVNTDGTGYTVLKTFAVSSDGKRPYSGLTLSGSTLYGTTSEGGSSGNGTVFKVNTDGTDYTLLKQFTGGDGYYPYAGLTLSGGTLYGTTYRGGSPRLPGTVFQMNTDGTGYTVLKTLTSSDGLYPRAGLTLSGNTLYGTMSASGSSSWGTVFKLNTDGTDYTVLKHFSGARYNPSTGVYTNSDGATPYAGLTLSGSTLYGTTSEGGSLGYGTVFRIDLPNPPIADASATRPLWISPNGLNAQVVLDGSRSSDPDGDPLTYLWLSTLNSQPSTALATGVVASVTLAVGAHSIDLVVDDSLARDTNTVTVTVLTTEQAVQRLIGLVGGSGLRHPRPLLASLEAALASIERGNCNSAANQLHAFQNKVRAQVSDPGLAQELTQAAAEVIAALGGDGLGRWAVKFQGLQRHPGGKTQLKFSAPAGRVYLVEASTNLVDWEMLGVAPDCGNGTFEFEDPNAAKFPSRFYRVLEPE